ncbi:ketopantoate reductase family protein [Jeotgalibacillus marinus]|uniref:2-dehydropantoate 2-reductase n=1 Tax=Jeotgalibacillus marinus TaxID=86667 RepID=A0ABV3Q2R9_9BACL
MNISILGAGAIGLLFSARLAKSGHNIRIITHHQKQADHINQNGITCHDPNQSMNAYVTASADPSIGIKSDCWILTVKQYQLKELQPVIESISYHTPIIFTQNGMGHLEFMESLPHSQLFVSTVEHGASKESSTTVHHNGIGRWQIAPFKGEKEKLKELLTINNSDFPILFRQEYYHMLLEKLIKNIMINSLTAIFRVPNGELIRNPYLRNLLHDLYLEMILIFPEAKSFLSIQQVESLCIKTAENTSSMNADLQQGRKTEVDSILGFAINVASQKGVRTPLLHFLNKAICGLEFREGIRS